MENTFNTPPEDFGVEFKEKEIGKNPAGLSGSLKEVSSSFKDMVQAEIRLAKVEIQDGLENVASNFAQVAIFGVVTVLGIFPLLSFLVIGLGRILNDNYWLSSLIVTILCFGIGGFMAYRALKAVRFDKLSLSKTRATVGTGMGVVADSVSKNVVSIQDSFKRRIS